MKQWKDMSQEERWVLYPKYAATADAKRARTRYALAGGRQQHVSDANRRLYLQKADEYRRLGQDEKADYYQRLADEYVTLVEGLRTDESFRAGYKEGLRSAYSRYQEAGGTLAFLKWAGKVLDPEVWNELFQYKRSSHVVSLSGLTREDGRRMGGLR